MKNYTITVNGTAYQVTVEEGFAGAAAPAPAAIVRRRFSRCISYAQAPPASRAAGPGPSWNLQILS